YIVLPAVIGAAQPVFLDEAVIERGATVGAVLGDEADTPLAVAKQHEILAEQLDAALGLLVELGGGQNWMPVAAQQRACLGPRPDAGHGLVFLHAHHYCLPGTILP